MYKLLKSLNFKFGKSEGNRTCNTHGKMRKPYNILIGKPEGKRTL
jgi:hypothetical protein